MGTIAKNGTFSLEHTNDGGTTWATVAGCKSFDMGAIETEEIDITDFDSTGNFREFAAGYQEASDGSFVCNYDHQDPVFLLLRAAQVSGATQTFRATYTHGGTGEVVQFSALVKGISAPVEIGGVMEVTVTIKLTGQPTYT